MVSGKPRRRCFCTTEHDLRRRSNTHLSSHPAGDASAVRSETDELHSAAHCRCNWEADESIGTTAETGAFGLKRVREREGETWDGRSALTQLPSGEGRTRVLLYRLHLEKRSRGMIREMRRANTALGCFCAARILRAGRGCSSTVCLRQSFAGGTVTSPQRFVALRDKKPASGSFPSVNQVPLASVPRAFM
jgi:hypothetical protein